MLRGLSFRHGVLTARVYITAVSNACWRPTRISYDLSLATYRDELGVSFSRLRTIRREVLDQLRDALVCSYYVRCVSTQRFWRTFR